MVRCEEMLAKRSVEKLKDAVRNLKFVGIFLQSSQPIFFDLPLLSNAATVHELFLSGDITPNLSSTSSDILMEICINCDDHRVLSSVPESVYQVSDLVSEENDDWRLWDVPDVLDLDSISFAIDRLTLNSFLRTVNNK